MSFALAKIDSPPCSAATIKPPPVLSVPKSPPAPSVRPAPTPAARIEDVDEIVIGPLGQRMPRTEFNQLRAHLEARIRLLPSGEIVTAKWLVGVPFWSCLRCPTKVGLAIAYMAKHALLPIIRLDEAPLTESCALYRLH